MKRAMTYDCHESIGMFRYGIMIPWERIRFTILHNIYIYYIHNTYKLYMIVIYDYDTHIHIYNHMYILIVLPQILIPEAIVPTLLGWLWLIHCFLQGCHWKGLPLAPSICWIPVISIGMLPSGSNACPGRVHHPNPSGRPNVGWRWLGWRWMSEINCELDATQGDEMKTS